MRAVYDGGAMASVPSLPATTEETIVLTLFDLANHLARRGEQLAGQAQLTTQQWLVLLQIAGDPNFPGGGSTVLASEIARARGVSRATVSVTLAALRSQGLISDEPDPEDARRRRLALTAAGAAAIESIEPARRAANQRLLASLAPRDRERFLWFLRSCLDVLWEIHEDRQTERKKRGLTSRSSSPPRTRSSRRRRPGR